MYVDTIKTLRKQESTHWDIADALVKEVHTHRDWDRLAGLLADQGIEYKISTLKAYRRVAWIFPDTTTRVRGASFAAHQAAATLGSTVKAGVALARAAKSQGKVTRDTVLAEVRQMKGRTNSTTSDAVSAWRDLKRGVAHLLDLQGHELGALLMMEGTYQGQAPDLSRDLAKVSLRIADAMAKAEKARAAQKNKAARKAAGVYRRTRSAGDGLGLRKPKPKTARPKVKVGKLGQGRGVK